MPVVHVVLLKAIATESAVLHALESLRQLVSIIPGLESFECGKYSSPEGINRGYTWCFTMLFADVSARDGYLVHPLHIAAAANVVAVCDGGINGVLAFDYEK